MLKDYEFWFVTGSQLLYGLEPLQMVAYNSQRIVDTMNASGLLPCKLVYKPIVKSNDEILKLVKEANYCDHCAGIVVFMHTFSPSKMWINGLMHLQKPYCHFHTQYNRTIPDEEIDMDYMNLHQSAHGDREHGFIGARLRKSRKIIVGYWDEERTQNKLADWMIAAVGAAESKKLKVMRFGDNMRDVAVTEGDKVEVQRVMGWQVNTWPVGELAERVSTIAESDVDQLMNEYLELYDCNTNKLESIRYQAREEIAIRKMLDEHGCVAYTNTFEDLYGLKQLPGLATQHLLSLGYGFGAEGDWKTAATVRLIKAMTEGKTGGTTFIEDYTYDLTAGAEQSLGAHMLEVCPTIADGKPRIEVHPLGIGNKEPPARLVFTGKAGPAILVSIIDMGGRLRMICQDIECVVPKQKLPRLPVARVMWIPAPDLIAGTESWIMSGGAHHSVLTYDIPASVMKDFARIMGIEFVHITMNTNLDQFEKDLLFSDLMWKLK